MPRNLLILGKGDYDPRSAEQELDADGNPVIRDDDGNVINSNDNNSIVPTRVLFEQTPSNFDGLNSIRQNIAEFAGTQDLPNLPFLRNNLAENDDLTDSDSDDNMSDEEIKQKVKPIDKQIKELKSDIAGYERTLNNNPEQFDAPFGHPFDKQSMRSILQEEIDKKLNQIRKLQREKDKYRKTKKSWFK